MVVYSYRCDRDGVFDVRRPMGDAPARTPCPCCAAPSARSYAPPMLSKASRAAMAAIDLAESTRERPEVVSTSPARPGRTRGARPTPAQQRLPRP